MQFKSIEIDKAKDSFIHITPDIIHLINSHTINQAVYLKALENMS